MSAFYAVAWPDRAELITDGAIYADDGTLLDIRSKVWASPTMPLAVTGRGNIGAVDAMTAMIRVISARRSVDLVLDSVATMLDRHQGKELEPFEIVVAAVSEQHGPAIYYFANVDAYGSFEPWTLYGPLPELGGGSPLSDHDQALLADLYGEDGTLRNAAVPLMEAMRRQAGPNPVKPLLPDLYGIGGLVDFTTVSVAGAETVRLHEWPDVIGEKIDPFREVAVLEAA